MAASRQIWAELCVLYGNTEANGYFGYFGMSGWVSDEVENSNWVT